MTAIVAGVVLASAAPASAKPADGQPKCTIKGSKRADTLRGTRKADVICGLGGRDRIVAADGGDVLRGGGGADLLKARGGDDTLSGGGGDDSLYGEDDDDELVGGPGDDLLDGGDGDNDCHESDGRDLVSTTCWMGYRIDNVSIVPPAVDTWMADREVRYSVRIADTLEGPGVLEAVGLDVESPAPGFESATGEHPLQLVDGTLQDGTWAGTVPMPRYSTHGAHTLGLVVTERMNPWFEMPWYVHSFYLEAAGLPFAIEQIGPGDSGPPAVASLDVSPRVVDTSSGPVEVQFTARIIDDVLGAEQVDFLLASPSSPFWRGLLGSLESGSVHDGVWSASWTFEPGDELGHYAVGVQTQDDLHNRQQPPHELEASGFNVRFEVR